MDLNVIRKSAMFFGRVTKLRRLIHSTQPGEDMGKMGVSKSFRPLDLIIKSDYPTRSKMKNQSDPEGVLIHPVG
jgi:hypothetical protein